MKEPKSRIWRKIGTFYALTMLFSGIFDAFILHAGKMEAGGILYVTGSMWSPALAVFVTKKFYGENLRELPWQWGQARYRWLGYLIPIAYALPVYVCVWLTPLGRFVDSAFVRTTAEQFGWATFPPALALTLFILLTGTVGLLAKVSRALGEEIGWRGFLVPELAKVVGFRGVAVISGLMWAAYHFPVLLFADYNAGTPAWYGLSCFTIMVVADSFILAWLTLRSRSLWPAAIFHGSHNLFIQSILTPLTRDSGPTKYVIDEFGVGLVITVALAAIILCRQRGLVARVAD